MLAIDVKHMCITPLPAAARFLALSYVWGTTRFLQLTKSNEEILKRKGALQEQCLPRTIEDAIQLTGLLSERYLWVDALCIVQDDMSTKVEQLSRMDRIYLNASLTIVNSNGAEANTGLTGLHPGSRQSKQTIETVRGVRFVTMSPPFSEVPKCQVWHSRAWTYQEYMLSMRLLIFTEQQVYYLCKKLSFSEDHHRPPIECTYEGNVPIQKATTDEIDIRHRINRTFRYDQNWHAYKIAVADLSSRQLMYEADVLKSMTGFLVL